MGLEVILPNNGEHEFYPQEWGAGIMLPNNGEYEIRLLGMGATKPCSQEWEPRIRLSGEQTREWQKLWIQTTLDLILNYGLHKKRQVQIEGYC